MKRLIFMIIAISAITQMTNAQTPPGVASNSVAAIIDLKNDVYDFGNIPLDIPVVAIFEFVNTGKEPLIITDVQKTCGCTNTEWPEQPVLPGEKGTIKATFNASSEGAFNKVITVQSNSTTPVLKLTFKGAVIVDDSGSVPEQKTIFNSGN